MGSSMTRATSSAASIENTSDVDRMSNFAKMFVTAALPILIVRFHQVTRQNGLINFKYPVCNDLPSASPLGGLHCLSPHVGNYETPIATAVQRLSSLREYQQRGT